MTSTINRLGIDLVDLDDLRARLNETLVRRILSSNEHRRYEAIKDADRKLQFLAGRFAAKEAYTKAYRTFESPLNFSDVDIDTDKTGAPVLRSPYRSGDTVHVSISHTKHHAVAVVWVESDTQKDTHEELKL